MDYALFIFFGYVIGVITESLFDIVVNKRRFKTLIAEHERLNKNFENICAISQEHDFVIGEILECPAITEEYLQRNPTALIGSNKKV